MTILVILFFSGIIAGILASVTGMASLVSYPILLAVGLPPVIANVTNTAALIFSGIGSTLSSRKELKANTSDLSWIIPISVLGSLIGGGLLLEFPSEIFEKISPFMISFVAFFFIVQPYLRRDTFSDESNNTPVDRSLLTIFSIFIIGIYSGYFGAASGIFMLLVFSMTNGMKLVVANALKNVTMGVINLSATIFYFFYGDINWKFALMMGGGLVIGGYVGPIIARYLPRKVLRIIIIIGAFILAGYMYCKAYF